LYCLRSGEEKVLVIEEWAPRDKSEEDTARILLGGGGEASRRSWQGTTVWSQGGGFGEALRTEGRKYKIERALPRWRLLRLPEREGGLALRQKGSWKVQEGDTGAIATQTIWLIAAQGVKLGLEGITLEKVREGGGTLLGPDFQTAAEKTR